MPAIILTICNLVAAYAVAVKRGYPKGTFRLGHRRPVLRGPAAGAAGGGDHHAGILGAFTGDGIGLGGGGLGAVLAVVYRKPTREQFLKAAAKAVKTTGTVLLLIGISSMFGYLIGLHGVAELTGRRARRHDQPRG